MNETIFREKSLQRIKSPESLDDYIRISGIKGWLLMVGIFVLLLGGLFWASFDRMDLTANVSIICDGSTPVVGFVQQQDEVEQIQAGMVVRIDADTTGTVLEVHPEVSPAAVFFDLALEPGVYTGKIVIEQVDLFTYLWN